MRQETTRLLMKDGELQYSEEVTMHNLYEEIDELITKVNELSDLLFELVDTKRGIIIAKRSIGQ